MKVNCIIFAVFALSTVVKGAWWVAAAQPIILSFGALFTAMNLDVQPLLDIDWKKLSIFKNEKEEAKEDSKEEAEEYTKMGDEYVPEFAVNENRKFTDAQIE